MDVHDPKTRSFNMSRIRGKNTKPELIVRKFLHARGFRFRLHRKDLPGKPDIVLSKYNTAIFVNGCFWHGHDGCKHFVIPKTRTEWWVSKIQSTKTKDRLNDDLLEESGWRVTTIWECELKPGKVDKTLQELEDFLYNLTNHE